MSRPSSRKTNGDRSSWLRWHRRVGLAAALVIVIVAITGVLLNHVEEFGLRETTTTLPFLTRHYAPSSDVAMTGTALNGTWLVAAEGRLFLDGRGVAEIGEGFRGAVVLDDIIAVASASDIVLLTHDGFLIERLGQASLPGAVERIGLVDGQVAVATARGSFAADDEFLAWRPLTGGSAGDTAPTAVVWALPGTVPDNIRTEVLGALGRAGVSLERLVLDLHTGRILGSWGVYLVDLAALSLIFLVVTGIFRRRPRNGGRRDGSWS